MPWPHPVWTQICKQFRVRFAVRHHQQTATPAERHNMTGDQNQGTWPHTSRPAPATLSPVQQESSSKYSFWPRSLYRIPAPCTGWHLLTSRTCWYYQKSIPRTSGILRSSSRADLLPTHSSWLLPEQSSRDVVTGHSPLQHLDSGMPFPWRSGRGLPSLYSKGRLTLICLVQLNKVS